MLFRCIIAFQFTWRHYKSFIDQTLRPKIVLMNRTPMQKYISNPKYVFIKCLDATEFTIHLQTYLFTL